MEQNIVKQLGQPESERLEYKAVLPPARSLAQMIAAFANTNGGHIVLGIAQSNGDLIINGLSEDFQANSVTHKAIDLLSPKPLVDYDYVTYQKKRLYIIEVTKASQQVLFEGKLFMREGTLLKTIPPSQPAQQITQIPLIARFVTTLRGLIVASTGSKVKFIEHYLGVLNIIADLGNQLYPESTSKATNNQEGKILSRILFSSCADNFETYLSDILYEIYLANPNTLKSSQQVTVKEVLDCADMEEFVLYWAKKKLGKLQRGSVKGFISDNPQIKSLNVIDTIGEDNLEKILQIRHLYAHRNGIVDEKFLQYYPGQFSLNEEHQLPVETILKHLSYMAGIVDKLDKAAVNIYQLATL